MVKILRKYIAEYNKPPWYNPASVGNKVCLAFCLPYPKYYKKLWICPCNFGTCTRTVTLSSTSREIYAKEFTGADEILVAKFQSLQEKMNVAMHYSGKAVKLHVVIEQFVIFGKRAEATASLRNGTGAIC